MPSHAEAIASLIEWNGENHIRFFQISYMLDAEGKKAEWEVTLFPEGEGWCKGVARTLGTATTRALRDHKNNKRHYPIGYKENTDGNWSAKRTGVHRDQRREAAPEGSAGSQTG